MANNLATQKESQTNVESDRIKSPGHKTDEATESHFYSLDDSIQFLFDLNYIQSFLTNFPNSSLFKLMNIFKLFLFDLMSHNFSDAFVLYEKYLDQAFKVLDESNNQELIVALFSFFSILFLFILMIIRKRILKFKLKITQPGKNKKKTSAKPSNQTKSSKKSNLMLENKKIKSK